MATAPRLESREPASQYRQTDHIRSTGSGGYKSKERFPRFPRREETPPGAVLERARPKAGSSAYKSRRSRTQSRGAPAKGLRQRCDIGMQRTDGKLPRIQLTRQARSQFRSKRREPS